MLISVKSTFAIESSITQAYVNPGQRALGFFAVHINGMVYGKTQPHSTLLACSFDEVQRRLQQRGTHTAPFALHLDGVQIAKAMRSALYGIDAHKQDCFGLTQSDFSQALYSNNLLWAPDGDEAFDDGSYILHFDVDDHARLIAFKTIADGSIDIATFNDLTLPADDFYDTLKEWQSRFFREWKSLVDGPDISGNERSNHR